MLVKTSYWQSHQQWVWAVDWDISSHSPLRHTQVYPGQIGAGRSAQQATVHHLPAILTNPGGPSWLRVSKCDSQGQKGWERGSRELQGCQAELSARNSHRADHLEWHQMVQQNSQGITLSWCGFVRGRSCLANLISCDLLGDERKAVDVVCLNFRKAFDATSNSIPLENLAAHGLDFFSLLQILNAAGCQLINIWLHLLISSAMPLSSLTWIWCDF